MMRRKHLERAVVLGLLLTNVCGVGGAAEYNTPITGSESGYDSIKVVDPDTGEITYTFAGGDVVGELPASGAAGAVMLPAGDNKNIVIVAGESGLTLQGGMSKYDASVKGIVDVNSGKLTFSGGKLSLNDLTTGAYLMTGIRATDGGEIVFNNTGGTEISSQPGKAQGISLQGDTSKITFGENSGDVKLTTDMAGIDMKSGTLAFNDAGARVTVTTAANCNAVFLSGGTAGDNIKNLSFKGVETTITSGDENGGTGAIAVGVNVAHAGETNRLEFLANETVLSGGVGLIVSKNGSFSGNADTKIHFAGQTKITGSSNDSYMWTSWDYGTALSAWRDAAQIIFDDDVTLHGKVSDSGTQGSAIGAWIGNGSELRAAKNVLATAEATADGKAIAIKNWVNGKIDIEGALKADATSDSGDATGLWSWDHSQVNVKGDTVINAVSASGKATGINSNDNSTTGSGDASLVQIGGNAEINVSAGGDATGITAFDDGNVAIKGGAKITAVSSNSTATGIEASNNGRVTVSAEAGGISSNDNSGTTGGSAEINVSAVSEAKGITAFDDGDVVIKGGAKITAVSSNSTATGIEASGGSSSVTVNGLAEITAQSKTGEAVGINGTMTLDAAKIFVDAKGEATGIRNWNSANVNFKEAAQIIVDAGGNNAKGIYGWNGGQVNFAGDAAIKIGGIEGSDKTAYYVRAITATTNSTVNVGGNAVFDLTGTDTIGLDVSDNSKVAIDGNYVASAKATGTAKGMGVNKSSVQINGVVNINANSSNGYGNGIDTSQSTVKMGSAYIKVNSDSTASTDNSLGIYSYWDTNITVDGDTVIEVTADKNNALGLAGNWYSTTAIGKSAQITVSSKQSSATGIKGDSNMTTTIGGDAVITAIGAGKATGVVTDAASNFTVGGDAVITAQSTGGGQAWGIDGGAVISGSAKITVSSLGGQAADNKELWHINGIKNWNSGTTTKISGDAVIDVTADISSAKGVYLWNKSNAEIGGNVIVTVRNAADSIIAHGLNADENCGITVGKSVQINVDAASNNNKGIYSHEKGGSVTIGESAYINVDGAKDDAGQVTALANYARGITGQSGGKVSIGGNAFVNVNGISAIGIEAFRNKARDASVPDASVPDAKVTIAGNYGASVRSSTGEALGIVTDNGGDVSIGGNADITVISAEGDATGLANYHFDTTDGKSAGKTEIKGAAHITAASSSNGRVWGIYNYNGAVTDVGSAAEGLTTVTVRGNNGSEIKGIEAMKNSSVAMHGAAFVDVRGNSGTEVIGVIAGNSADTSASHSAITFGDAAYIKVGHNEAASNTRAAKQSFGVVARNSSTVTFAGDTVLDTGATAAGSETYGAYVHGGGSIEFAKGLVVDNQGKKHSLYVAGTDSSMAVNSSGSGDVYLTGDITAINEGTLALNLNTAHSYFEGAATTANAGKLHMQLRRGALWNLTADSDLTSLDFGGGAVLDLAQAAGYQNLKTATMTGSEGTFVLGTDIMNDKSDKVFITDSTPTGTSHHNIQIKDAGRNTGDDLHLLLVDDASGKYSFTAQDAYGGGIYTYKAEFSNETDGGIKWYLESLKTSSVTQDVKSLSRVSDGIYALVVTAGDSLRGRLGELRSEGAESGAWARVYGGRLKGDSFKDSYQTYQLGYDAIMPAAEGAAAVWSGGAALEYTKGNIGYGSGSGENKMSALALYGTRHSLSGDNVDIILKHGRIKGEIETYGIGANSGDYDTNATSLSVEYNKRLAQKSNTFIEPQAQLTLMHISGSDFTTDRGITVHSGGINSAIGRLGLAVGKQYRGGDVYFKASALHEFGGSSDMLMTAAGESYSESKRYGGSWCELALGGNVQLGRDKDLYFDVTRSLGGDFQKQWQLNAGLRWSF